MPLATQRVSAFCCQDYPDWHKGRRDFGLWYIEIERADILKYCQQIQAHCQPFLAKNYQRQLHITVFVAGFVVPQKRWHDDIDPADLDLQYAALQNLDLPAFRLSLGAIDSFEQCLFVHINDRQQSLARIRDALQTVGTEISPPRYCPHITLGFYQNNFLCQQIFAKIAEIEQQPLSFWVKKLTFGSYQATDLQGKLTPILQWELT